MASLWPQRSESPREKARTESEKRVEPIAKSIKREIQMQCSQWSNPSQKIITPRKLHVYDGSNHSTYACLVFEFSKSSLIRFTIEINKVNAVVYISAIHGLYKDLFELIRGQSFVAEYSGSIAAEFSEYLKPILKMITVFSICDQYYPDITHTIINNVSFTFTLVKHNILWFKNQIMFAVNVVPDGFIAIKIADNDTPVNIANITELIAYIKAKTNISPSVTHMITVFDQELDRLILLQDPVELHALLKEFECKLDQLII